MQAALGAGVGRANLRDFARARRPQSVVVGALLPPPTMPPRLPRPPIAAKIAIAIDDAEAAEAAADQGEQAEQQAAAATTAAEAAAAGLTHIDVVGIEIVEPHGGKPLFVT